MKWISLHTFVFLIFHNHFFVSLPPALWPNPTEEAQPTLNSQLSPSFVSQSLNLKQKNKNHFSFSFPRHQSHTSQETMAAGLGLSLPPPPPLTQQHRSRLFSACLRKPDISLSSSSYSLKRSNRFVSHRFSIHRRLCLLPPKATADQQEQGQVGEEEVVDSTILQYCSIDKKGKKSLGELEQEFLQALQSFYYENKAIMSNEEFDLLKEELMWEGSSVVMLSSDEQKFLEASMAYVAGKPLLSDAEFDQLKLRLKQEGSSIVQEGPRCSLRSRKVYSDLTVDYFKMFLLNVPAAVVALTLFFFLDDLTGFEITYLLELPEPFSFIFTWFAALPLIFWVAQAITNAIIKDFLILKGPCPNCGTENVSFFGTILNVPSGGAKNTVKCSNCSTELEYDSGLRLIIVDASQA